MQIKIFVNESPIYITDELSTELRKKSNDNNVLFITDENEIIIDPILAALKTDKKEVIILVDKIEKAKALFLTHLTIIEAAGGIVQNEKKEILFIFRRGKWDLPKGKIENNETPEISAAREIEEETGVTNLILKRKIGETYHIYEENKAMILKTSHWFYFLSNEQQDIKAQTEEDITKVKWIHTRNIKEPMANTYQNIKDILSVFFDTP
mgnify:CR=1 FL=1|jgi:ADP-ribose pyrophosphatase YjhB (NUDIX family)